MSYTRRFSEVAEDFESSASSVGVFNNSRSSLGSTKNGHESKRRKTSGLNSRFDRMVETMNATHRSPIKTGRRRRRTASSSTSVATSDLPQTPLDAYNDLQDGRLGKDFALIKMNNLGAPSWDASKADNDEVETSSSINSSVSSITKRLPEWLCNTFSTLTAKHPLRLLLPGESVCAPKSSMMPPPAISEPSQNMATPENDPVFAFSVPGHNDEPLGALDVRLDLVSESSLPMAVDLPSPYRSTGPSMLNIKDACHCSPATVNFSSLGILPFSTPGPGSLASHQAASSPASPSLPLHSADHAYTTHSMHASDVSQLNFIPFLTPGPGSTLFTAHGPSLMQPTDFETSSEEEPSYEKIPPSLDFIPFTMPGPSHSSRATSPLHNYPYPAPKSIDPPVYPGSTDPAPSYSSDDIPDYNAYYEDPLTDDSTSDPHLDQSLHAAVDLPDIYATPAPAFRPPRPIYFDSPTEDPLDSDPLQPGYEIDYGVLDFRWEPYDRKGSGEDERTPNIGQKHQIYTLSVQSEENAATIHANDFVEGRAYLITPERLPSPSPFRFPPHSDEATSHDPSALDGQSMRIEVKPEPEELQQPAPVFAPAPGIFISPLRGSKVPESQPASPLSRELLETLDKVSEQFRMRSNTDKKPEEALPNSQVSNDSIESWRDAVDTKS